MGSTNTARCAKPSGNVISWERESSKAFSDQLNGIEVIGVEILEFLPDNHQSSYLERHHHFLAHIFQQSSTISDQFRNPDSHFPNSNIPDSFPLAPI